MINPNGIIVYEGPSRLDNKPIVVIATGLKQNSTNAKTGAMIQTYILRQDIAPAEAVKTGEDVSICGDCVHRGDGTGKGRSCYVTLFHGPRGVYGAYSRKVYAKADLKDVAKAVGGRMVRLGTYGDPAAVPLSVIEALTKSALGHTGYTHQWRKAGRDYAKYCMASADTEADMHEAHNLGFRTFRVTSGPNENIKGLEIVCPASEEAGRKTSCVDCKACMGTSGKAKVSIQIAAHGAGKNHVKGESK